MSINTSDTESTDVPDSPQPENPQPAASQKLYTEDEVRQMLAVQRTELEATFERVVQEFYADKAAELLPSPQPG